MPIAVAHRKVRQGHRKPRNAPVLIDYEFVKDLDGVPQPKIKRFIYLSPNVITKLRKHKQRLAERARQAQERKKKQVIDRYKEPIGKPVQHTPTPEPPPPSGSTSPRTRYSMMQTIAAMASLWRR